MLSTNGKSHFSVSEIIKAAKHRVCKEGKRRLSTFGELEECAKSGCDICIVILQGVREWAKSKDFADSTPIIFHASKHDGTMPRFLSILWIDAEVDAEVDKDDPYVNLIMYTLPRMYLTHIGNYPAIDQHKN